MPAKDSTFQRYWFIWLTFGSGIGIAASLVFRDYRRSSLVYYLIVVALLGLLGALPYLSVKLRILERIALLRWAVIAASTTLAFALLGRRHGLYIFAILAILWLCVVNLLIFALRRFTFGLPKDLDPVLYFLGDFWLISVLAYLGLGWYYIAAMLAASKVLVMLSGHLNIWISGIMLIAYALFLPLALPKTALSFAIFLAAITVALGLLARSLRIRMATMVSLPNQSGLLRGPDQNLADE